MRQRRYLQMIDNRLLNDKHALCMIVLKLGNFESSNIGVTLLYFG